MTPTAARDDVFPHEEPNGPRWWHGVLYAFLILVFVTGGSSQERGWSDAIAELAALPVLAFACWTLGGRVSSNTRRWGVVAMAAVTLLPWLQLLPLPQPLWQLPDARSTLHGDLAVAGVTDHALTWSLTPTATVRGALSLLPAAALFVAVLARMLGRSGAC